MNSKVSIIIPVYNAAKSLEKCLDSVINQKYHNFEIVLIDDGSKDNSLEICNMYANKYDNIKVYSKKNGGVSSARNLGINNCSGEYISFIDSDDYINSEFINELVKLISIEKVDIAVSGIIKVPDYNYNMEYKKYTEHIISVNEAYSLMLNDVNFYGYSCNKLYKKKIIVDNKLYFDESIHICEDLEFNARYFEYVDKVAFCSEKLYYYFKNVNSATNEYKYSLRQASVLTAYDSIGKIYKKVNHELYDVVLYNYIKNRLNINYRLYLIKQQSDFEIMNSNEKNIIIKSKNLSLLKKIYIILSCNFPIVSSKIKSTIKKVRVKL